MYLRLKQISNLPLSPKSPVWKALFWFWRALYVSGLYKPNTKIEIIANSNSNIILVPLSGSSLIKKFTSSKIVNSIDSEKSTFIIYRNMSRRMQSFYNKKVRNPNSVGKCRLLASCYPLTWKSSVDDFLVYLRKFGHPSLRDRHLWTCKEIIDALGIDSHSVTFIDLEQDPKQIEKLLNIDMSQSYKSSKNIATFQQLINFNNSTLSIIDSLFPSR